MWGEADPSPPNAHRGMRSSCFKRLMLSGRLLDLLQLVCLHGSWVSHTNILLEAWDGMRVWILHWNKAPKCWAVSFSQTLAVSWSKPWEGGLLFCLVDSSTSVPSFLVALLLQHRHGSGQAYAAHRFWIEQRKWVAHLLFKESHEWHWNPTHSGTWSVYFYSRLSAEGARVVEVVNSSFLPPPLPGQLSVCCLWITSVAAIGSYKTPLHVNNAVLCLCWKVMCLCWSENNATTFAFLSVEFVI